MKNFDYKKWLPHGIALAVFALLTYIYFAPFASGFEPRQADMDHYKGMAKEIQDFRDQTGEEPLWTNSMFGGMPAYQIDARNPNNIIQYIDRILMLGFPGVIGYFFLLFTGFYILTISMKINWQIGVAAAMGFAFASYIIVVVMAGHNTKVHAIAYMPAALGGFMLLLRGRMWLGAAVFTLFMSLQIFANHYQISYYMVLVMAVVGVNELITWIKEKKDKIELVKRSALFAAGLVIALITNSSQLWSTYEYGKDTTRGSSELTITPDKKEKPAEKGLDADYITQWSYGVDETFTFLAANAKGGSSMGENLNDFFKKAKPGVQQFIGIKYNEYNQTRGQKGLPLGNYWGDEPFIMGPTYFGAILIYLFLLGIIFVRDPIKWAIVVSSVLIVMLSWGKNYPGYDGAANGSGFGYALYNFFFAAMEVAMPVMLIWTFYQAVHRQYKKAAIGGGIFFALFLLLKIIPHENFGDYFIHFFPGYNKFRSVTFTLTVLILTLPFMAALFLKEVWENGDRLVKMKKAFYITSGIFLVFMLMLITTPKSFISFLSADQAAFFENLDPADPLAPMADEARAALEDYRMDLFKSDVLRSLGFFIATAVVLLLFFLGKINRYIVTTGIGFLLLMDHWGVDKRYFNNDEELNKQSGKREYVHWQEKGIAPYFAGGGSMKIFEMEAQKQPGLMQQVNDEARTLQEDKELIADKSRMKFQTAIDNIIFPKLRFSTHYRVLETGDPFNNSGTSYHHKSVGGYHGAKLKRYQELIEFYLSKEHGMVLGTISNINGKLEDKNNPGMKMMFADTIEGKLSYPPNNSIMDTLIKVSGLFENTHILNMLNTKYILYIYKNSEGQGIAEEVAVNPNAGGVAWFTDSVKFVPDVNSEMLELGKINPLNTAVIHEEFRDKVKNTSVFADKNATVSLVSYAPNYLVYETNSTSEGFVVFSEIYYNKGWNAFIDGSPADHVRVNYVLRGMDVPSGKRTIEFKFEPENWYAMKKISLAGNLLMILAVAGFFFLDYKQRSRNETKA